MDEIFRKYQDMIYKLYDEASREEDNAWPSQESYYRGRCSAFSTCRGIISNMIEEIKNLKN